MDYNNKIRVMIADKHEIVGIGIKQLLSNHPGINMVAYATSGEDTKEKIKRYTPDVVIMDDNFSDINCREVMDYVRKWSPKSKVIIHPTFVREETLIEELRNGISGYVPKNMKTENLIEAIRTVHKGESYLRGKISKMILDRYFKEKKEKENLNKVRNILSKREIEVLKLICEGISIKKIANKMNISIRTADAHRFKLKRKLKIRKDAELVKYGIKHNLVTV